MPDLPVSSWVKRFIGTIPAGKVLDLACGEGRHSAMLAAAGKDVLAVDRNPDVLIKIAEKGIETLQIDLESNNDLALAELFQPQRFAGIVVTNYLHRPLVPLLLNSIADQGVLLYETFVEGNQQFGRPSNPDFLLASGELLRWLAADSEYVWHVVAFEEGYVEHPKPAMVQRLCAVKGTAGSLAGLQLDVIT
ncbi:SAM-dependent methyltransferase [Glaciimonas sp. PCH181]|nr:methyltransferase domain-containing protein [Glaciimonas sp. PCH181]PUA19046.1 SAM-dependent methyltransferase [Glaciimonas sp. PCH181]